MVGFLVNVGDAWACLVRFSAANEEPLLIVQVPELTAMVIDLMHTESGGGAYPRPVTTCRLDLT